MPEKHLVSKILKWCKQQGIYARKIHGSQFQHRGLPDIHCIVDGKAIWFEVKTATGKPSEVQLAELNQIRRAGGHGYVIRSLLEVQLIIRQFQETETNPTQASQPAH
jgi:hypothetical protein